MALSLKARVALLGAAGFTTAAVVAYYRGRRGLNLVRDVAVHGTIATLAFGTVSWAYLEYSGAKQLTGPRKGMPVSVRAKPTKFALPNPLDSFFGAGRNPMGKLGPEAIALLSKVNGDELFRPTEKGGIVIGPTPQNPFIVQQKP